MFKIYKENNRTIKYLKSVDTIEEAKSELERMAREEIARTRNTCWANGICPFKILDESFIEDGRLLKTERIRIWENNGHYEELWYVGWG